MRSPKKEKHRQKHITNYTQTNKQTPQQTRQPNNKHPKIKQEQTHPH